MSSYREVKPTKDHTEQCDRVFSSECEQGEQNLVRLRCYCGIIIFASKKEESL